MSPPRRDASRRPLRRHGLRAGAAVTAVALLSVVAPGLLGAGGGPASAAVDCTDKYDTPDVTTHVVKDITFPIIGSFSRLRNYGDNRGNHIHAGEDIGADKMQKIVSATAGTVVRLKYASDGNYLYVQAADGWIYGYLHINNDTPGTNDGKNPRASAFAPGIEEGVHVLRGQHLAYVGDSGNAETTISHLHFEIRKPNCHWYQAQAVSPEPSLDAAHAGPQVPASTFKPWTSAASLVTRQYPDILRRPGSPDSIAKWVNDLQVGAHTPDQFIATMVKSAESEQRNGAVVRLYLAVSQRIADHAGYEYWLTRMRNGTTLEVVAQRFAQSSEFVAAYGALDDPGFVDLVYQNVLHRAPDAGGRQYWTDQLAGGASRGEVMLSFTESSENRAHTTTTVQIVVTYDAMLGAMISPESEMTWQADIDGGRSTLLVLIKQLRLSAAYKTRVGA
jgi:hypothetical protein